MKVASHGAQAFQGYVGSQRSGQSVRPPGAREGVPLRVPSPEGERAPRGRAPRLAHSACGCGGEAGSPDGRLGVA